MRSDDEEAAAAIADAVAVFESRFQKSTSLG